MIEFRDKRAKEVGMELIVYTNPKGAEMNISPFTHGSALHTDIMKTEGLKNMLNIQQFDAVFGGARRDEENQEQKREFTLLEIKTIDGIQKIKDQSYGIFIMEDIQKVSLLEFSHYQTGQNLIFGNISI